MTQLIKNISLAIILSILSFVSYGQEICNNRIDDDGDGLIDCIDSDCSGDIACWDCITSFYQVHSNSTVISLDPSDGTYNTIGSISDATQINAAQFNHIDGHIYAPCLIDGAHKLGMINNDGSVFDTELSLPGSNIFFVGSIDEFGGMYVSKGGIGLHYIDLSTEVLTVVDTGHGHPGVADLAYNLNTGNFYGINGSGKLVTYNPSSGSTTQDPLSGSINSESGAFGAAWSSSDGSFFAYNNSSGKIYSVDIEQLIATEILNGTGNLSSNDGFNCVMAPPPFETACGDGIDNDGDGFIDCDDNDCYQSNLCLTEICDNGIDDDGDGFIDCDDSECSVLSMCIEICDNGIDDNGNGLIDEDDPQCNTSSGVDGGLESNRRLSDKIANRNYQNKVLDANKHQEKREGIMPFSKNKSFFSIGSFIPDDILEASLAETSPTDLIGITNAIDVVSADYYIENQRIASILAIESENGVYEHTKYICDRLSGSQLVDISYLNTNYGLIITYELMNQSGQKEYAASFSGYIENDIFNLESHWNIHKYTPEENFYNFQIWSRSNFELIAIIEGVLKEMNEIKSIDQINHSSIPKVFVTYGEYLNGQLKLNIKNKDHSKEATIQGQYRTHEKGSMIHFNEIISLSGSASESLLINTGFIYDFGFAFQTEENTDDELFIADGSWGIDETNPQNEILSFDIIPQTDLSLSQDGYQIERSINIEAMVKDYLNIYRSLTPNFSDKDFTTFDSFLFEGQGSGKLQITLVKSSIENWEDQYHASVDLSNDLREFILKRSDFSSKTHTNMEWTDISMIVFTIMSEELTNYKIDIKNIQFANGISSLSNPLEVSRSPIHMSPNPASSEISIAFSNHYPNGITLKIVDALGKTVQIKHFNSINKDLNKTIDISNLHTGIYYYSILDKNRLINTGKLSKI